MTQDQLPPDWLGLQDQIESDVVGDFYSVDLPSYRSSYAHRHARAQFTYCLSGIINCEVGGKIASLGGGTAIWIPGETMHKAFGSGRADYFSFLINPNIHKPLPRSVKIVAASTLLQSLIRRVVCLPRTCEFDSPQARMLAVMMDEISAAPEVGWLIPTNGDARFKALIETLMMDPSDGTTAAIWATRLRMSDRAFRKEFAAAFGTNFSRWRQQLHIEFAVARLVAGETVQNVSDRLGYESASSFVNMFKRTTGCSPARYVRQLLHLRQRSGIQRAEGKNK